MHEKNGHNFHVRAVMSIIGDTSRRVIGFDQQRIFEKIMTKEEGELNVSKNLISSVKEDYCRLVDVVVYDALACNSL